VSPLDFSTGTVAPIQLGGDFVMPGTIVTVSGWGAVSADTIKVPNLLRKVDIPVVSNNDCDEAYGSGSIADTMLCAGLEQGTRPGTHSQKYSAGSCC